MVSYGFSNAPWLDVQFFLNSLATNKLFSVTKDIAFLLVLLVPVPQGQIADNILCCVIHSHYMFYKLLKICIRFLIVCTYILKNGLSLSNLRNYKKTF